MGSLTVLHNPRCSKSRGALEILRERGVDVTVVEYLADPPSRSTLEAVVAALPGEPAALVRRDDRFRELGLDPGTLGTGAAVVDVLLAHPELMERPVAVTDDGRARICRPPEIVLELLEDRC